jgi:hypothetical protein
MTQTDLSIRTAVKSPPSGSAKTDGLVEGDGAFLAYLGQTDTPTQPNNRLLTSHAANRPAPMATATLDDMIPLATLPQQQDQTDPQAPASAAARPPIDDPNRVAQEPESDALTADDAASPAPAPFGMPLPALGSTAPMTYEIATTQQSASANALQRAPSPDVRGMLTASLDAPELLITPNEVANILTKTSPTQIPPTNSARPAETDSVPAPLADLHMFKTSGQGADNVAQTEAKQTPILPDLPNNRAQKIPSELANPLSPGQTSAVGAKLALADLPTGFEGGASTKSDGASMTHDAAKSSQTVAFPEFKLSSEPDLSQPNRGQIAATPRNDVALFASQPVQDSLAESPLRARQTASFGSNQIPSLHPQHAPPKIAAPLPGAASTSAIALMQGQKSQVLTILQPSAQPPEAVQVAPPLAQAQTKTHGPEAALRSMLPATETSARTLYTSADDASELASNPERKSLYASVFSPTGFSASPAHTVAQPSAAQPAAVPIAAIAEQMKTHSATGKPSTIELTLTPEDLGKIRLVMVPDGDKIRIVIHADRPETLDLIRRNTDSFSADLRQAGYSNASFSFGSSNGRQPDQQTQGLAFETPADTAPVSPAISKPHANRSNLGGLDLRV